MSSEIPAHYTFGGFISLGLHEIPAPEDTDCPICQEPLLNPQEHLNASDAGPCRSAQLKSCGHTFHDACIAEWLTLGPQNHRSCPCCRQELYTAFPASTHMRIHAGVWSTFKSRINSDRAGYVALRETVAENMPGASSPHGRLDSQLLMASARKVDEWYRNEIEDVRTRIETFLTPSLDFDVEVRATRGEDTEQIHSERLDVEQRHLEKHKRHENTNLLLLRSLWETANRMELCFREFLKGEEDEEGEGKAEIHEQVEIDGEVESMDEQEEIEVDDLEIEVEGDAESEL